MRIDVRRLREVVTLEGVPIPFEVADAGDRLLAFVVDLLLSHLAAAGIVLASLVLVLGWGAGYGLAVSLLASFLVRNFYFTYFEIRMGGSTPGKRRFGLRVVSRDGGPLTPEAVIARNLTRDLEVFLPATALLSPESLLPDLPDWAALLGCAWVVLCGVVPLLSRDRLRVGDILAGTIVVAVPRATLLEDLTVAPQLTGVGGAPPAGAYAFEPEQLDIYGIAELEVLEGLLRRHEEGREQLATLAVAAERIRRKIGWRGSVGTLEVEVFLRAFYRAQRARLEHKLLFGVRRRDKRQGAGPPDPSAGGRSP